MTTPAAGRPGRSLDVLILVAALLAIGCGVAWFMARQGAPAVSSAPVEALSSLAIDAQGAVAGDTRSLTNVDTALKWIARVRPKRAVLTNLHIDLDYEALKRSLPEGVEPAYDGMTLSA